MSRPAARSCSTCGTSLPAHLHFCPQCGAPSDAEASAPTTYTPSRETHPPPDSYHQIPNTPLFTVSPPQAPPGYHPGVSGQQRYPPLVQGQRPKLVDAWALQKASRSGLRRGMLVLLVLLVFSVAGSLIWSTMHAAVSPPLQHVTQRNGTQSTSRGTPPSDTRPSLLYTNTDHTDKVNGIAWSPNGKYIASGSADQTVQVIDARTGKQISTYRGHSGAIQSLAWSPDSTRLASGSEDMTVQVWNATTGGHVLTYKEHTGAVYGVAWSPDGMRIASAAWDDTVQVWKVTTGAPLVIYKGHTDDVDTVAWSPDSKHLASAGADHTVQVWEADTGARDVTYTGHTATVDTLAWSPDGIRIASGSIDKTVQVWDALTGKHLVTQNDLGLVYALAWSPDGQRIANGEALQMWNVADPNITLVTFQGESGNVLSVTWSPDGKFIAFGDAFGKVQIWQPGTA